MRLSSTSRIIPILAALIGLFLFHRYSLLTGLDRVQADTGDSRFVAFLLEHWNNALHGRAAWNSPPIFWPERNALAYSDLLVGMGVLHTALRAGFGVFAAMNLQLILLSLATFATAYLLLVRGFRLSVWGATAGAYFFAFSWPRFAQLVHVQLQFTALLPLLALLALECLRDGRTLSRKAFGWRACSFAVLLVLTLATTLYYAVFAALTLTVALALCLLNGRTRAHLAAVLHRQAIPLVAAAALGAVLLAPIVLRLSPGHAHQPRPRLDRGRQLHADFHQPVLDGPGKSRLGLAVRALARGGPSCSAGRNSASESARSSRSPGSPRSYGPSPALPGPSGSTPAPAASPSSSSPDSSSSS